MSYLDLAELPGVVRASRWFWSARRPALAWFRRADFLGPGAVPLDTAVRDLVQQRTGRAARGTDPPAHAPALLRLQLQSGELLLRVRRQRLRASKPSSPRSPTRRGRSVTPTYCRSPARPRCGLRAWRFSFEKQFHVSPFMPMDMRYEWCFGAPAQGLHVHMENWREGAARFDATLNLAAPGDDRGLAGARARCSFR